MTDWLRKIDELVAEHVMGLEDKSECPGCGLDHRLDFCPRCGCPEPSAKMYSSDMNYAWRVVEKLREDKIYLDLSVFRDNLSATFTSLPPGQQRSISIEETAPLAICIASLKAKDIELPKEDR